MFFDERVEKRNPGDESTTRSSDFGSNVRWQHDDGGFGRVELVLVSLQPPMESFCSTSRIPGVVHRSPEAS
jgi:hypothetical protein